MDGAWEGMEWNGMYPVTMSDRYCLTVGGRSEEGSSGRALPRPPRRRGSSGVHEQAASLVLFPSSSRPSVRPSSILPSLPLPLRRRRLGSGYCCAVPELSHKEP